MTDRRIKLTWRVTLLVVLGCTAGILGIFYGYLLVQWVQGLWG